VLTQTFFLIFPLMWHNLFTPSMHMASSRPFPSILRTCAYSACRPTSQVERLRACSHTVSLTACKPPSITGRTWCDWDGDLRWPSSLKMSSRFSSPSFFPAGSAIISAVIAGEVRQEADKTQSSRCSPLLRFFPPFPAQCAIWMIAFHTWLKTRNRQPTSTAPTYLCSSAWLQATVDGMGVE